MKRTPKPTTILLLSGMLWLLCSGAALAAEKEIMGWVERVEIAGSELAMKAKLDSGAKTSSLDASDIEIYRVEGKRWVRFTITDEDSQQSSTLERPLQRYVRIIRHSGEHQRRPVVEMEVCLGHHKSAIEFSLIDRSNFIYPVLLGRAALAGQFLLDVEETFLSDPDCAAGSSSKDAD